jgi:hypothetical protein
LPMLMFSSENLTKSVKQACMWIFPIRLLTHYMLLRWYWLVVLICHFVEQVNMVAARQAEE